MSVWCSVAGCSGIAEFQIMDKETLRMVDYCKEHYDIIMGLDAYDSKTKKQEFFRDEI